METVSWEYAHLEVLNGGWISLSYIHPGGHVARHELAIAIETYQVTFHTLLGWLGGAGWELVSTSTDACASFYSAHLKRISREERPTDSPPVPGSIWEVARAGKFARNTVTEGKAS